jgi:UDP-N-acetylglucosamine 2-epimerase (non-hydrolysing)
LKAVKVVTVLGTRPEIIRLSRVIPILDELCDHVLVHTGQNYDDRLSGLFFRDLGVREPNISMGIQAGSFGDQIGQMLARSEEIFETEKPDTVLVLGDTNSGITAFVAKRMGLRVAHMEAGNRCFDDRVPEEVNRRVIDHCSTVLMPYTHRSAGNLAREGIERQRIFVTGNPIKEVLDHYAPQIEATDPFSELNVEPGKYFLVTAHRTETVDDRRRLASLVEALNAAVQRFGMPAVASLHPRTADKLHEFGIDAGSVRFVAPLGLFNFVRLEKEAYCVLSDSGTVQEECCIFGVPTVTMRDVTERPETVECGSNILAGVEADRIIPAIELATRSRGHWTPPPEYMVDNVSDTVAKIILGIA